MKPPRLGGTGTVSAASVPVFLTAQQVADMLQVDERTVLRWAQHDASMPATRLGRVVRFEREPPEPALRLFLGADLGYSVEDAPFVVGEA